MGCEYWNRDLYALFYEDTDRLVLGGKLKHVGNYTHIGVGISNVIHVLLNFMMIEIT